MGRLSKHSKLVGGLLLLLFVLSTSGFTAVLHSCLMTGKMCCDMPMAMHPAEKDRSTSGTTVDIPMSDCCVVKVVGGLNGAPITVDNAASTGVQKLEVVGLIPAALLGSDVVLSPSTLFSHSLSERVDPPSVEKYVLNATFLI